jgi:hypothetical protein
MTFAIDQFFSIRNRSADIFDLDAVFAAEFVKAHSTGETAEKADDWHTRPTDHRLAVLDLRIDRDSIIHLYHHIGLASRSQGFDSQDQAFPASKWVALRWGLGTISAR